tara:strand:+ start:442 stop:672 length:231 start_codon:yes stop_codon:yes gene_type:complete
MQKIINVLALASTVVSVTVVGVSGYVYLNREAIIEDIKEKALGGLGGSLGGDLPIGAPDLASPAGQASLPVESPAF